MSEAVSFTSIRILPRLLIMGLNVVDHAFLGHFSFFFFFLLPTILACVVAAALLLMKKRAQGNKLAPGPPALPIIGHLHLLGNLPHHSLYNLSKVHGPLMSLRLGVVPCIVASTPDIARQILQMHDQAFSGRPRMAAPTHILSDSTDIGFSPPNSYWKHMRQLCMTALSTNKGLESSRSVRTEEVGALMQSILADNSGAPFAVRAKLLTVLNNIISRMVLGKKVSELASSCQGDPSHNMLALIIEAIDNLGVLNLGDYIPFFAWMDLQGCVRRSKVNAKKLKIIFQEIIDDRRDKRRDGSPKDLLDVLLLAASAQNAEITDDNIYAVLLDMFGAGIDTSSITIEWALAELLVNPEKMKAVQGEIDDVVGRTHIVQESDIPHLPYLQAVVKETLRLHPVLPLLIPHESNQPCVVCGFEIPSKTRAYINVWAIGRDPNTWDKPIEFLPERFLDGNVDMHGQHFELLPFGSGRRRCPGMKLGLLNVQIILASLLQGFEWTVSTKVDMSEMLRFVMMKAEPLVILATPRLPTNLYAP